MFVAVHAAPPLSARKKNCSRAIWIANMAAYSGSHYMYDERDRIDMNTARVTDLLSASGIAPASLSSEERAVASASTPARRDESPVSKPLIRLDRITKRYGAR
ncbi:hypothetical protein OKW35_004264 [Paraburkholderia sp. MM5477-R1]